MTPRGIITRAPASQSPWGIIPRRVSFVEPKIQTAPRNLTKIENILTHRSVAQADLNMKKM